MWGHDSVNSWAWPTSTSRVFNFPWLTQGTYRQVLPLKYLCRKYRPDVDTPMMFGQVHPLTWKSMDEGTPTAYGCRYSHWNTCVKKKYECRHTYRVWVWAHPWRLESRTSRNSYICQPWVQGCWPSICCEFWSNVRWKVQVCGFCLTAVAAVKGAGSLGSARDEGKDVHSSRCTPWTARHLNGWCSLYSAVLG